MELSLFFEFTVKFPNSSSSYLYYNLIDSLLFAPLSLEMDFYDFYFTCWPILSMSCSPLAIIFDFYIKLKSLFGESMFLCLGDTNLEFVIINYGLLWIIVYFYLLVNYFPSFKYLE